MATPPANTLASKAPLRGVFPLDHKGECKDFMRAYLSCMQQKKSTHYRCSDASRDYLECRMSRGLMTEEDLDSLGYAADRRVRPKDIPQAKKEDAEPKERIAGLQAGDRIRKRKTAFGW
ncbi:hypothetical protein FNF27_08094 [Cafeteria roenbergensis]|uniref:CHCH domain-containing protein n=2 Tax=Cafeteria roenbergensis TaxID=33653 RepID=A0A5A8DQ18_CAFRO|nr:hypothetical protein FNF27_08094 [Cafeteria roenbergensis]KAA0165960.1 hypothetical protein FNF31_01574 [Cafeteria roenbergensis]